MNPLPTFLARFFGRAVDLGKKTSPLEIYTDGSSKDGVGSWAFLISQPGKRPIETSGRVRLGNSNVMEFRAAIEALRAVPSNSTVTLFSDSRIVIDAMKTGKGPRAYQPQIDILMGFNLTHAITWRWIKAHGANKFNQRCDELCTLARGA